MTETKLCLGVDSEVARQVAVGDWTAAELAEAEALSRATTTPVIKPQCDFGECPQDSNDYEAIHKAEQMGRTDLATRIKDEMDIRHKICFRLLGTEAILGASDSCCADA